MPMADADRSEGGGGARRPKWDVYSDDNGNMYFFNTRTGETAWELPPDNDSDDDNDDAIESKDELQESARVVAATGDALVSNQLRDADGNLLQLTVVRPKGGGYSAYQIAVEVIETVMKLMDMVTAVVEDEQAQGAMATKKKKRFVSPAAERRAMKNDEIKQKRLKRERLLAMTRYMNILIPPVATPSAQLVTQWKRPVGALFTREDARKWRLEREVQQIRQRYKARKRNAKHHEQVYARANHDQFLKQFRSELLRHYVTQIPYSSELQQQRIMLLTTPQQLAEMELHRKATLEPELMERYEAEAIKRKETMVKNIQKVFVLADRGASGSLHLLQVLLTIFSDARAQAFAVQVRGLSELVSSAELQRFVVEFATAHHTEDAAMSLSEFFEFVQTIEDVLGHYDSVKAAVREAEEEIATAIEAANQGAGSSSLLRARLNMVSAKKVEQEMAALRATQQDLEAKAKREKFPPVDSCSEALIRMMAKEEWEKYHQHRYIQIDEGLPVYCCLCRRRKWELWRQELEQQESEYRGTYSGRYKLKLKMEELRIIRNQEHDDKQTRELITHEYEARSDPVTASTDDFIRQANDKDEYPSTSSFQPRDEDEKIVMQTLRTLVMLTERIHSSEAVRPPIVRREHQRRQPAKQLQTGSPQKKKKQKRNAAGVSGDGKNESEELDELQLAMIQFESEEYDRKLMSIEDSSMNIYLERSRRLLERPRLQQEDAAHNAYIRLLSHCVNPSSLLYRLQVERSLSFSPPQHLTMLMMDGGLSHSDSSTCRRLVLHTVPCRTEQEAAFIYQQVKCAQDRLTSPFVTRPASTAKHTYQFFAESGMLIECWPVVFVAVEYWPHGSWVEAFQTAISNKSISTFAEAEARIIRTFRDVAAGLAAMHSNGVLHLNFNLGNIYLREPMQVSGGHHTNTIEIGGFLAFKRSFQEDQLRTGNMAHCLNPAITPPEVTCELPVSTKSDAWMLGCALYEALMIWQSHDLRERCTFARNGPSAPATIVRLKNLADIFQEIPLATSAPLRSLLRMLLQASPSQRPRMAHVVDILTFAGKKTSVR